MDLAKLPFLVLPQLQAEACAFYGEVRHKKASGQGAVRAAKKRRGDDALRVTDPW